MCEIGAETTTVREVLMACKSGAEANVAASVAAGLGKLGDHFSDAEFLRPQTATDMGIGGC